VKKQITTLFVYSLVIVITLGFLNTYSLAQKQFEGYLEQTTIRTSNMPMQPPKVTENEKVFYKSGKFKSMNLTTKKAMIYRFDKELMWTIDHDDKSYTEVTFAQMQEGMQKMRTAMKQEMKDVSPEERKMMEKFMGKKLGKMFSGDDQSLEITVKRTGKTKKILDDNCELIFLNLNDDPMMEIWITDKYSMGNDFLEVYQKMGFMKGKLSDDAKKIQGIPLATKMTIDMGMGKMESESTVTKLVETSVSDSEFEVPNDYKKKESGMPFK
jgi:hypothetical protein